MEHFATWTPARREILASVLLGRPGLQLPDASDIAFWDGMHARTRTFKVLHRTHPRTSLEVLMPACHPFSLADAAEKVNPPRLGVRTYFHIPMALTPISPAALYEAVHKELADGATQEAIETLLLCERPRARHTKSPPTSPVASPKRAATASPSDEGAQATSTSTPSAPPSKKARRAGKKAPDTMLMDEPVALAADPAGHLAGPYPISAA